MRRLPRSILTVVLVGLLLAVLHLAGVRESTHVLAGIVAAPHEPALALLYLAAWFFTLLVSPIVLIALALRACMPTPRDCYAVADAGRDADRSVDGGV